MTIAMAEMSWSWADVQSMTFREIFIIYQHALEIKWNYRSALLSEIHNQTVALIRLNSKQKPKTTKPSDFHPFSKKTRENAVFVNAKNMRQTLQTIGDFLTAANHR